MATVLSALVYTLLDQAGNPRTEAWLTLQYGEEYANGGVSFDLSPYFRRIDHIATFPMSGGTTRSEILPAVATQSVASGTRVTPIPRFEDYGTPVSARFELAALHRGLTSGIWSGAVSVERPLVSGPAAAISGIRFGARAIGY